MDYHSLLVVSLFKTFCLLGSEHLVYGTVAWDMEVYESVSVMACSNRMLPGARACVAVSPEEV